MHSLLHILTFLVLSYSVKVHGFSVTASNFVYTIDGSPNNPSLAVTRGQTYSFVCSGCDAHPFYIKSALGSGTTGQYTSGISGSHIGTLTFAVPNDAPSTLYYQCSIHQSMNGVISVSGGTTPDPTPAPATPDPTPAPTPDPTPAAATPSPTPALLFTGILATSVHKPTLQWSVNTSSSTLTARFSVASRNGNWFGVGFSTRGLMINAQVIVYSLENSVWKLCEYSVGGSRTIDTNNCLTDYTAGASIHESGGVTTFTFTRPLTDHGVTIDLDKQAIIWAVGSSSFLSEHGASKGVDMGGNIVNFNTGEVGALDGNKLHTAHGFFMVLAWGVLLPLGVWCARYKKNAEDRKDNTWFKYHQALQLCGFLFFVIGFLIAVVMQDEDKKTHFKRGHPTLGLVMMILASIQILAGIFRADHEASWRAAWEVFHKYFGRVLLYLAFFTIFSGFRTLDGPPVWMILFIVWLVLYHGLTLYSEYKLRSGRHALGSPSATELGAQ